jgi:hypothetical protein
MNVPLGRMGCNNNFRQRTFGHMMDRLFVSPVADIAIRPNRFDDDLFFGFADGNDQ